MKYISLCGLVLCSCINTSRETLFSNETAGSGVDFSNTLQITDQLNPYTFRNFFNGGGVALGDINNDGLVDIYFTGNQVVNKLYLNKGNFKFEDITEKAGVSCSNSWSTGVTFIDLNADGYLDIYVCKSGPLGGKNRHNELFINNGDLTFTEKAQQYNLDITGLSVQAAFFDYDKDGDLDCYLLTNSIKSIGNFDLVKDQRTVPAPMGEGNMFLVNQGDTFIDYTDQARIYRSAIGFGLGITLGDFNDDGWSDIFVSNDFFERDYLYLNDQDGTFTEALPAFFQSISMGSMGADFADLNNDGSPELFVTEMLPDSLSRRKTKTLFENWDRYQLSVQQGYHHQFSRNVLQTKSNVGNYYEIGRMAGVAATEWSWGALLFDMDNDGLKDIFVANGIYKDLLDRDYLTFTGSPENIRSIIKNEKNPIIKLINQMPSSEFSNYAFRNRGQFDFDNVSTLWGFNQPLYSGGSAYGDLDNDGDLDLVINNINADAALYRNNTDTSEFKSINILLAAKGKNTKAIGSFVTAFVGNQQLTIDNYVSRGFQSSVDSRICLGVGQGVSRIDSVIVRWPTGEVTTLRDLSVNELNKVSQGINGKDNHSVKEIKRTPHLTLVDSTVYHHRPNHLVDFNRERLLPMMYSDESPRMIKGDINGDGTEEVYVSGAKRKSGLLIRIAGNQIAGQSLLGSSQYSVGEESGSTFFDADQDGDLDLYQAAGGRFYSSGSNTLIDKLWFNNGSGTFTESGSFLTGSVSTSVVKSLDFDRDGDMDLVVGERFNPTTYGLGGGAHLLENTGDGNFQDVTHLIAPTWEQLGMVTDIAVCDYDRDGLPDVVIVGDWIPIRVFKNERKKFIDVSVGLGMDGSTGWWHVIEVADLNEDGQVDFVVGNNGLNSFFRSLDRMYVGDFDNTGSTEQIFCTKRGTKYYPIHDKDEFLAQFPSLKKKLLYYREYSEKSIEELFPQLPQSVTIFEVQTLASMIYLSDVGKYKAVPLPKEGQYSSIYGLLIEDLDRDGVLDIVAGGNLFGVKPQFGRQDASNGWLFKGNLKNGHYTLQNGIDLNVKGQIRDIEFLDQNGKQYLFFAKNNESLEVYRLEY